MKTLWLTVVVTALGVGGVADAQLARTQPTEKLLILWLPVTHPQDTALSFAVMDAVREKVNSANRNRIFVVPRAKICEALGASGFSCDVILEAAQARDLARFLQVDAFVTGRLTRDGNTPTALVRVVDMGRSGLSATFEARGTSGTPADGTDALADTIAGTLNTLIRAGEHARSCSENRERNNVRGAITSAQRALQVYPNAAAAHLCVAYLYEIQHQPADSIIAALRRGLAGDSMNTRIWDFLARQLLVKHDSAGAVEAFEGELRGDPTNLTLRTALATLLLRMKQYPRAHHHAQILAERSPSDANMNELVITICKDGEMWGCYLRALERKAELDPAQLTDSSFYTPIIGAAQAVPDTTAYVRWTFEAAKRFDRSAPFVLGHGDALFMAGKPDSALVMYRKALRLNPADTKTALRVAQTIIEGAVWDTAAAGAYRRANDTVGLRALQERFAAPLDTAKGYLDRVLAAGDTMTRIPIAVLLMTGGSKLAVAQVFGRARPWLGQSLDIVRPRTPADTTGPRQAIRANASLFWGFSSMPTLAILVEDLRRTNHCREGKALNDRVVEIKAALTLGVRSNPRFANSLLQNMASYEQYVEQVKRTLRCRNF